MRPWAQAPVTFSLVQQSPDKAGAEGVHVKARNKQLFASTAGLLFTWRLLLDGAALPIGDMLQQTPNGWHPGGQVAIEPQVIPLGAFSQVQSGVGLGLVPKQLVLLGGAAAGRGPTHWQQAAVQRLRWKSCLEPGVGLALV